MNKYARVIGIAFVLVTVFSASTLVLTVDMYQAVADTKLRLTPFSGNIYISEIRIPPIYSTETPARVTLLIEFEIGILRSRRGVSCVWRWLCVLGLRLGLGSFV